MKVYVVWSCKNALFELYSLKPQWNQESAYWSGVGYIGVISESDLPKSIAHEARRWGRAVPCHAEIQVKYAFIG